MFREEGAENATVGGEMPRYRLRYHEFELDLEGDEGWIKDQLGKKAFQYMLGQEIVMRARGTGVRAKRGAIEDLKKAMEGLFPAGSG